MSEIPCVKMTDTGGNNDLHEWGAMHPVNLEPATDLDYPILSNANVYPDPDDMPTYPWLGTSISGSVSQFQRPSAGPTPWSREPSIHSENDGAIDMNDRAGLPARRDPNHPLVDPDFQFSEDSAGYVQAGGVFCNI